MLGRTRFGITFPVHRPFDTWPMVVEPVERYEALGFDAVYVPDHFVFPWEPSGGWLDGWSLLAGLAARTERIRLDTMVTHVV